MYTSYIYSPNGSTSLAMQSELDAKYLPIEKEINHTIKGQEKQTHQKTNMATENPLLESMYFLLNMGIFQLVIRFFWSGVVTSGSPNPTPPTQIHLTSFSQHVLSPMFGATVGSQTHPIFRTKIYRPMSGNLLTNFRKCKNQMIKSSKTDTIWTSPICSGRPQ